MRRRWRNAERGTLQSSFLSLLGRIHRSSMELIKQIMRTRRPPRIHRRTAMKTHPTGKSQVSHFSRLWSGYILLSRVVCCHCHRRRDFLRRHILPGVLFKLFSTFSLWKKSLITSLEPISLTLIGQNVVRRQHRLQKSMKAYCLSIPTVITECELAPIISHGLAI